MNQPLFLTKTAYLAHTQCHKRFWLEDHQPGLGRAPDPSQQRRLVAGNKVDKLAREQFKNGRLIPYRPQPAEMADLTAQAIAGGAETLFQATFASDDLLIKADILTHTGKGWHLIEVKSTTRYKKVHHLPDIAFQIHVLQQAGLSITQASLMHLNTECRYPDLSDLFILTEVTEDAIAFLPQIAIDIEMMRQQITRETSPDVTIGRHCRQPYECPFHSHCWQEVNGWTIYDVTYLRQPKEAQLAAEGTLYLADIPASFALGDKRATAFVERVNQQQIMIDQAAIAAKLKRLAYPLYFFDFETIDEAIPAYPGCKPYQQIPFQYSCHILYADGHLEHRDFLHTAPDDPRPALVAALLADIGETGHLIAYNIPFERGILNQLADQFPAHQERLQAMANRLWDQLIIFRQHYQHYAFGNSHSLKSVLPVIVPALSYGLLDVQNGTQAQVVWEEMIRCEETAVKNQLIAQLRQYCALDTLAMVEIHKALVKLGD